MIFNVFNEVENPRGDNNRHKFIDIIGIALCAVTSGIESYNKIEEFGQSSEEWLKQYFELPNRIPSHDTLYIQESIFPNKSQTNSKMF